MKELIKRLLREYEEPLIQRVDFDGFSDPVLIPQFRKYLVKFEGTGKYQKVSDGEKIIFTDTKTGKEYEFNADDVQKNGSSPFYINLDVLRRYYDIRFEDEFVRQKVKLDSKDENKLILKLAPIYNSQRACKNEKCSELRDVIEKSLLNLYGNDYGDYQSQNCQPTRGFLNVYPIKGTEDDDDNLWSKLNYLIYDQKSINTLLITYLKTYGTFEHSDFIEWVEKNQERLFNSDFLNVTLKNIYIPVFTQTQKDIIEQIQQVFPTAKLIQKFCPANRTDYNELITVDIDGEKKVFQPVKTKNLKILKEQGKYYIFFSRRNQKPNLSMKADYIIIPGGAIFENRRIVVGDRAWEFPFPPIYNPQPFITNPNYANRIK
jgi:hypothetical protein